MSMFSIHEIFPDFYRNFDVSCRDSDIFAAACKKGRDRRAFGADPGPFNPVQRDFDSIADYSVMVCVPALSVLRTVSPSRPVRMTSASASNGTVNV